MELHFDLIATQWQDSIRVFMIRNQHFIKTQNTGPRWPRRLGKVLSQQRAYHIETARNELIKLPVFEIKCKAMMGICIYW